MCLKAGNIADVLQAASALPRLTKLDFTNQFLTGTFPANISFPSLEELILVNNDITVQPLTIPTCSSLLQDFVMTACIVGLEKI